MQVGEQISRRDTSCPWIAQEEEWMVGILRGESASFYESSDLTEL
jgi:hypothetical protein